ncbi:unnamed protein product [Malus baccata var. baccata]
MCILYPKVYGVKCMGAKSGMGMGLAATEFIGMKCIVTKSGYTAEEEFQKADAVFDFFGNSSEERFDLGFRRSFCQTVTIIDQYAFGRILIYRLKYKLALLKQTKFPSIVHLLMTSNTRKLQF